MNCSATSGHSQNLRVPVMAEHLAGRGSCGFILFAQGLLNSRIFVLFYMLGNIVRQVLEEIAMQDA